MNFKEMLIVDDDLNQLAYLSALINSLFPTINLHTFSKGADAVEFSTNNKIDFALVDFLLQDINGLQVVCEINEQKNSKIPGALISSFLPRTIKSQLVAFPEIECFLKKPILSSDIRELFAKK